MIYIYDARIHTDYINKKRVILYALTDSGDAVEHAIILSDPAMANYDMMFEIYDVVGSGAIVTLQEDVDIVLTHSVDRYVVEDINSYREASEEEISSILTKIQEGLYQDYYIKPLRFKLSDIVGKYTSTTTSLLDLRVHVDGRISRVRIIQTIMKSYSSVLSKLSYIYTDLLNIMQRKDSIPNKVRDIIDAMLSTAIFAVALLVAPSRSTRSPAPSFYSCEAMWIYLKPLEHLFTKIEGYTESDRQLTRLVSTYRSMVARQKKIKILDDMLTTGTTEEKKEIKIE